MNEHKSLYIPKHTCDYCKKDVDYFFTFDDKKWHFDCLIKYFVDERLKQQGFLKND